MTTQSLPTWWLPNMSMQPELQHLRGMIGRYAPKPHPVKVKQREPEVALGAIKAYVSMRSRMEQALMTEVASARAAGCSWADVARVLGVTHQAAIKRYAKVDPKYAEEGPTALAPGG